MPQGTITDEERETNPPAHRATSPPPMLMLPSQDVRRKRPPALSFLLRMDTARRLARVAGLLALDFAGVFAAIFTALIVKAVLRDTWDPSASLKETQESVVFAYMVVALLFARAGLYSVRTVRPGMTKVLSSLFAAVVVSMLFALVNGEQYSSYWIFYGSFVFAVLYIGAFRLIYELSSGGLLRAAGYKRRALLVGSRGKQIDEVAHALGSHAHATIEMVGFVSLTPRPDNGLRSLGEIDDLPRILEQSKVQEVIIADPDFPQDRAVELVDECHRRGVTVRVAPSTMEILASRAEFVPGSSVPLFELRPPVFEGFDFALKRSFDVVVSGFLLLLMSPLLALVALAVRLTSSGPVIYRSVRPGIGGEPFACFKFRTMRSDADQLQADLESLNEADGALFKIRDDPRMTPVGGLLRRFSLDELPQLFNVLGGQMSLVGPRPLPERDYEKLDDWHKKRYLVLPGITGLWQVSGRSELDFDDLVRLDFLYLERWSIALDLTILLKTVPAVFARRGAF